MARNLGSEAYYQDRLIKRLKSRYEGCQVYKMEQRQGIPDILILYKDKWAFLENKRTADARRQPNQPFYIDMLNYMSFARFCYPENEETVLGDLDIHFDI